VTARRGENCLDQAAGDSYARLVVIREEGPQDAAAVRRLLTSAFGDTGQVADLAEALATRVAGPRAALVAEAEGTVVGHVQLSAGWIDADPRLVEALVLSPLGVEPAHQRRGIGQALCNAALEHARRLEVPAVFLEGDPGYYARLGWQRASGRGFTAPSKRIPDPGFQVAILPSWRPWMVGAVVFNDTFWMFDRVGLRKNA
jgi:putative acetyltransferase